MVLLRCFCLRMLSGLGCMVFLWLCCRLLIWRVWILSCLWRLWLLLVLSLRIFSDCCFYFGGSFGGVR